MKLKFRDQNGNELQVHEVPDGVGELKIGRSGGCAIRLESMTISREHLLVKREPDGRVAIQDLQSTFGTLVNRQKIPPGLLVPLQPGLIVQLAHDVFMTLEGASPATATTGGTSAGGEAGLEGGQAVFPFFLTRNERFVRETFARLRGELPPEGQALVAAAENEVGARVRELSAILEVSFALSSITSFQRLLEYTMDMALQVTGAERGGIILFNEQTQKFETAVVRRMGTGEVDNDAQTSGSLIQRCFQTGETIVIRDTGADPNVAANQSIVANRILSIAVTPLRIQSSPIGVLYLDNRLSANTFTERVQELLRVFAAQASVAIHNARLYHLATTDGLTGLTNQKHFQQRLLEEFFRARRHRSPLTLAMIDIDHFKQVNNCHGHVVGDRLLRQMAKILRDGVRINDLPARCGGEEFAVLLPETPLAGAMTVAEKLRETIQSARLRLGEQMLQITVSIGIAQLDPERMDKPVMLMQAADGALYRAKRLGRNRIEVHEGGESAPPAADVDGN